MCSPRYGRNELWEIFLDRFHAGERVESLTGASWHRILTIDAAGERYQIEYGRSGNTPKPITLNDLYALYCELCRNGQLTNEYVRANLARILPDWTSWHMPGSAMFAILPHLDDNIHSGDPRGGGLHLRERYC